MQTARRPYCISASFRRGRHRARAIDRRGTVRAPQSAARAEPTHKHAQPANHLRDRAQRHRPARPRCASSSPRSTPGYAHLDTHTLICTYTHRTTPSLKRMKSRATVRAYPPFPRRARRAPLSGRAEARRRGPSRSGGGGRRESSGQAARRTVSRPVPPALQPAQPPPLLPVPVPPSRRGDGAGVAGAERLHLAGDGLLGDRAARTDHVGHAALPRLRTADRPPPSLRSSRDRGTMF